MTNRYSNLASVWLSGVEKTRKIKVDPSYGTEIYDGKRIEDARWKILEKRWEQAKMGYTSCQR
jgi:hypothetical protein